MNRYKHAFLALAMIPLVILATAARAEITAGDIPPDLLGKTPKGEDIRISDHRGTVMVVSFWASWCPHCRAQFPMLDYLQQHIDPSVLRVVVVNFKEEPRVYRDVLRQTRASKVTWTHDRTGVVSEAYGVTSVPRTFLIDKSGRVAMVQRGYSEAGLPSFFAAIDELLAEPAPVGAAVD